MDKNNFLRKTILWVTGIFVPILVVVFLNLTGFNRKTFQYNSDQEYIDAAAPLLKQEIKNFPFTETQKKEMNFKVYVEDEAIYFHDTGEGGLERRRKGVPKEALRGGKAVFVYLTPPPLCWRYAVEVYVSHQLDKTILVYADYPENGKSYKNNNRSPHGEDDYCPRPELKMNHPNEYFFSAAAPLLKEIVPNYPKSKVEEKMINFDLRVRYEPSWYSFARDLSYPKSEWKNNIPEDARTGGVYVNLQFTPETSCQAYEIDIYVPRKGGRLNETKVIYSNYPGHEVGVQRIDEHIRQNPGCEYRRRLKNK